MSKFLCGAARVALFYTVISSVSAAYAQDSLRLHVPVGGGGSQTAPGDAAAERQIRKIPGGADVVPKKEFEDKFALTLKDVLQTTPGVFAQPRYGEETRLSIRGSGLSRAVHLRGITLLQNGIPYNFTDGSGDFQEIDPLTVQRAEVFRGGQALRFGAASLGGAINFVTPTARTAGYNGLLRVEGGSFGTIRAHGEAAKIFDRADMFAATTRSVSEGFRQQSEQNNLRFSGNAGLRLGDRAETRLYIQWNDIEQDVPGTITKAQVHDDPEFAPLLNRINDYERDVHSKRIASRTALRLDNGLDLEFGGYVNDKDLYHPIFQVIDQGLLDYGAFGRASGDYNLGGHRNEFTLGANLARGKNDAKRFVNVLGRRGALTANAQQTAKKIELYGENRFYVTPDWSAILGAQASVIRYDYNDYLNAANNDSETYRSLNPKAGLLYQPAPDIDVFASVTKSSEPPSFSEQVQGAFPGFVPVDQQRAWTAEIGTRGTRGAFSWDATAYRSWVRDELLNFTVTSDVPASTFNADRTIHQGLELGLGYRVTDHLSFNGIYNLNDFYFENDAQFGDNDLAGSPKHQIRLAVRYENRGAFIEPNIEYVPEAPYVDYANTLKADDYTLLGVNAGWDVNDRVTLFVDARNLTDEKVATSFSAITDARTAATNVFYPADGRSVFAGIKVEF